MKREKGNSSLSDSGLKTRGRIMNILVTGAKGFVGRNLVEALKCVRDGKDKTRGLDADINIFEYDVDSKANELDEYCREADFVFNLAGVNRPKEQSEFMSGNFGFAETLLNTLEKHNNKCPVMLSSSIQAALDNPYGKSKKAGEELFFEYSRKTGADVLVYRFPNVFGKWCRPNYNSAVATFCNNIAHDLPITVNDRNVNMRLVYIDDVVDELIRALGEKANRNGKYCEVPIIHEIKLGEIVDLLYSFKENRKKCAVPDMSDAFTKKLYAAYLSYLPEDSFSYDLKMNCDERGSFTEIIRTPERGQFSVNISKPGITKGNHWHNTKNEKFAVVKGHGVIRFRKIGEDKVYEYFVSGDKIEVVDIPTGYTHNIENLGDTDMITFMWANECFDPNKPDTFYEEV